MTLELIECPHCGYVFKTDMHEWIQEAPLVRRISDILKTKPPSKVTSIDLSCPQCKRRFKHKVK